MNSKKSTDEIDLFDNVHCLRQKTTTFLRLDLFLCFQWKVVIEVVGGPSSDVSITKICALCDRPTRTGTPPFCFSTVKGRHIESPLHCSFFIWGYDQVPKDQSHQLQFNIVKNFKFWRRLPSENLPILRSLLKKRLHSRSPNTRLQWCWSTYIWIWTRENDAMPSSSTAVIVSWAHTSFLTFPPLCWGQSFAYTSNLGTRTTRFSLTANKWLLKYSWCVTPNLPIYATQCTDYKWWQH